MREKVIEAIMKCKLIAILRGISEEDMLPVAQALYAGGIRLTEITFDASGTVSDTMTASAIQRLRERFGADLFVGAGTVLTPAQAELAGSHGAAYIISPDVNPEVIRRTTALGMVSIPGAMTPSEIQTAYRCGADFVKVFPVGNLGPAYLKAVRAPLPQIRLLAVGGINEKNIGDYLRAGACGAGIGSNITPKNLIAQKDYAAISTLAEKYVQAVMKCC